MLGRVLKNTFIAIFGLLLLAYLLIWALSPWLIKSQAKPILEEFSYQLEETSHLRFNPFTFTLSFESLALNDLANENTHARINNGHINLDSFGLLRQAVVFESVSLDNAELEVSHASDTLTIAGYAIDLYQQAQEEAEVAPSEEGSTAPQWRTEIINFSINNFVTRLSHQDRQHALNLSQLTLENVAVGLSDQRGAMSLSAQMNEATLAGQISFGMLNDSGKVIVSLSLDDFNPQQFIYLADGALEDTSANISAQIEQTISLAPDSIALDIQSLSLKVQQLAATTAGIRLNNALLELNVSDASLAIEQSQLSALDGSLNINLEGLATTPATKSAQTEISETNSKKTTTPTLFSLASLGLEEVKLSLDEENQAQVFIPKIEFKDILASDIGSNNPEDKALFKSASFALSEIRANANALSIQEAVLAPFTSALHIDPDKNIVNLVLPRSTEKGKQPEDQTDTSIDVAQEDTGQTDKTENKPFRISLGKFLIDGDSHFSISDESVQPAFEENFKLSNISLGAFDSVDTKLKSPYSLDFNAGQYAHGSLSGAAAVFSEKLNLDIEASIKEFSLPSISPYVRGAAGMDMLSGQFDNELSLAIIDDELQGNSTLMLRGLEVETASDVKTGSIGEHAFIPLGLALGALKDSDGNIEMDIPLSGNVNDPDVGLNGFIYLVSQKAALSAAESYAINTFVPYANIVSLTKMAGEYALKVRIDDLVYEPAQLALSSEQSEFIDGFVALLEQKPDLQVKACPFASAADLESNDLDLADKETIKSLKKIAKSRGERFKETLIKEHSIPSAKILLCQATIDGSEDALPRIEFSI